MTPEDLRYSKTHEWVRTETAAGGEQLATVGITDFALQALTDLVHLELPAVGRQVQAGEPMGEVESVKAVSDVYSPVDGEVVEANTPPTGDDQALAAYIERLARDPYGAGWLVKIRISDPAALARLLDHRAYQKQCEQEASES